MAAAISALKPVLDPTNSSEVVIYESSSAQETAALLLDKLASTNEKTSPLLTQEVAVRTREINNIRFPAVTSVLMDNSEGFKMVTAVASFPSGSQPDFQKIMAIFSKEPLSPTIADQLPYVMQEFKHALAKLKNSIAIHEKLVRQSAELRQAQLEARVDKLTSIPNRRWFVENVLSDLSEIERAMEDGKTDVHLGLLFGDIDKFGIFNKEHGHNSGDVVLSSVAQALYSNKRGEDFAARYGGEEFLVTLPGINAEQAVAAAERHRKAIAAKPFRFGDEPHQETPITMSFGVVPMEVLVRQVTMETVSDALISKGFIKFVSEKQVEASKKNGTSQAGGDSKIIQPDLIFDPNNPNKSLHDLRLLIAFEYAHAISSKANHSAKEAGRNRVFRAEYNEETKMWEAIGTKTVVENEIPQEVDVREEIDIAGIKFSDLIIQGSLQEYLQALAPYTQ